MTDQARTREALKIGSRIREIRQQKLLSLQDVASAGGLSVSMLSHVERNQTQPSLSMLESIRKALQVPMTSLFADDENASRGGANVVLKREQQRTATFNELGLKKVTLSPTDNSDLEVFLISLDVGGGSGPEPWMRAGEKAGYLVVGEIELRVGEGVYQLVPGDSFQFDAREPHWFKNTSTIPAEIVWIIRSDRLVRSLGV